MMQPAAKKAAHDGNNVIKDGGLAAILVVKETQR